MSGEQAYQNGNIALSRRAKKVSGMVSNPNPFNYVVFERLLL